MSGRALPVSDRTLSRLIRGAVMVLAVAVPLAVALHFLDRGPDHGPTLIDRQIAAASAAVRKTPNEVGPRLLLAQLYQGASRPDDALEQYDQVLTVKPKITPALIGRADILLDKGDLDGAARAYERVVKISSGGEFANVDKNLEHAYYGLGSVTLKQSRAKDAVSALESAVAINAADADAWYLLGVAALQADTPKRAVEALQKAVLFVPTGWCEPYDALSQAYAKLGSTAYAEYAGAMTDFCKNRLDAAGRRLATLTSGPARVDALLGLGLVTETRGDRAAAMRWYKKVLAADRANFNAQAGLSRLGAGQAPTHTPTPATPPGGSSTNATPS